MKFLAVSDLHGNLPNIKEEFDLLMIPGDICPDYWQIPTMQIEWIDKKLIPWINNLPFKNIWSKVILVPGNHDICFDGYVSKSQIKLWEIYTSGHLKILNHDIYDFEYIINDKVDKITIFGTPYCKKFGNWSFMVDDNILERKYSQIPENIDILLSHDSPDICKIGGVLDEDSRFYNPNAGNKILSKYINKIKPKIFHSGHMHSGNHELCYENGIWLKNVSYVNEDLEPIYGVFSYDFDCDIKNIKK